MIKTWSNSSGMVREHRLHSANDIFTINNTLTHSFPTWVVWDKTPVKVSTDGTEPCFVTCKAAEYLPTNQNQCEAFWSWTSRKTHTYWWYPWQHFLKRGKWESKLTSHFTSLESILHTRNFLLLTDKRLKCFHC